MSPERWEQIQVIFNGALALETAGRPRFLVTCCAGDQELHDEVQRMIEENSRRDSVLYQGLEELAGRMIESPILSMASREIGAYRLLRLLGKGGMGVVYLAERTDTGKQVAMKFLLGAGMSPARRALFTHEIKTHAKQAHPCIAAQYDAGTLPDGTPWFVMEYVKGEHFIEYFAGRRSSLDERLRLFRQVCQALEYLHGKGIIHSDLKPSNILVDEGGTPRVLDFGIAKELRERDGALSEPRMMTRGYAAPEWVEHGIVDQSTDVYSLGVIFREMLADRPFAGASPTDWRELDKICGKALHGDAGARYQSVEALRRDLDHFVHKEPLEGVPGTRWYRLERFTARRRNAVVAAGMGILLFAGMAAFFTVRLAQERNAALAEVRRTKLVEQFLFNLFQGGDKEAGPAADVRALTLIGRGEQQAHALGHDPALQAEFYGVVGRIYQQLGQFDKANELLTAALKQKYAARANTAEVADGLLALGSLRREQARFDDAARIVRKALALRQTQSPPDGRALAKTEAALGFVLVDKADYQEAIALLKQAEQIESAHQETQADLAATLVGLSDAYFFVSRYPVAESYSRQALQLHRKLNGLNHPLVAIDLRNLGHIADQTTHFLEAEKYFREALAIEESWYGEDHPETADMRTYVAQALEQQGRLAEAGPLLQESLATMKRAYTDVHPRVALVLNAIGILLFREGRFEEAAEYDRQALDIYRRTLGDNHQHTTVARNNLASAYLKLKRYAEAESIFREVLAILRKENLGSGENAGITQIKLGRALTRQGRYREAEVELRAGCRIVAEHAGPTSEWIKAVQPDLQLIESRLGSQ